jgi:hypothetical protein
MGLERGPLSLLSTTEELLGKNSSGSDLENREYGLSIYPQNVCTNFAEKRWSLAPGLRLWSFIVFSFKS